MKRIFLLTALSALALTLISCSEIKIGGKQDPLEFLETNYEGDFFFRGTKTVPARINSNSYDECQFFSFYSSALKRNVLVKNQNHMALYSNFLFFKYENFICNQVRQAIGPDFNNLRVLFDAEWCSIDSSQPQVNAAYMKDMTTYEGFTVIINADAQEMASLEKRIESSCFAMREAGFEGQKVFLVNDASLSENALELSNFSFDDLCNEQIAKSKFQKCYVQNSFASNVNEVEL